MNGSNIHINSARLKGIYREAYQLVNKGFTVLANYIPEYNIPPELEGFIPDIYAVKENKTYILMIESAYDSNLNRTNALQNYASGFEDTFFETCYVNAAGCRI